MPGINSNRVLKQQRLFETRQRLNRAKEKMKSAGPKMHPNGKHFQQQNRLRDILEKVRPRAMKPQQEFGTGVDYVFAGKKIDFKFGFGTLGHDTISVRLLGTELLNKSDWTMVCNERGDIMIFSTNRIRDFVAMNRSTMKQNMFLNKGTYTLHKIPLGELLGEVQYKANIRSAKSLLKALQKMNRVDNPNMPSKQFRIGMPTKKERLKTAQAFMQLGVPPQRPRFDRRMGR